MLKPTFILLVSLALATTPALAGLFPAEHFRTGQRPGAVAIGDLDLDGTLDLVTANALSYDLTVRLGHGDGTFVAGETYPVRASPESIDVGDFNNDGLLDLVAATSQQDVKVLLGLGNGLFAPAAGYPVPGPPLDVAVNDVDQDGRLDLVVTTGHGYVTLLLGREDGTFAEGARHGVPGTGSVAVDDFDEDGLRDLVTLESRSDAVTILRGRGDGTFADPAAFAAGDWPRSVAVGDFDRDGHTDVVTANLRSENVTVMLGRGDGTLAPPTSYEVGEEPVFVTVSDLDGDGREDLLVAKERGDDLVVLRGRGDGAFGISDSFVIGQPSELLVGDVNGDGKSDVVASNWYDNATVLLGKEDGRLAVSPRFAAGRDPWSVAVDDFDRDGWADLVTANRRSDDVTVLVGLGNGSFSEPVSYAVGGEPWSVVVDDFDRDGRADLVTANGESDDVTVLLGRGDGTFADAVSYAAGDSPRLVAVSDFDRDGRADLVTANGESDDVTVLLGRGDGTFTEPSSYTAGESPVWVAVGDFDRDGRDDLVTANRESGDLTVLLGRGDGTFADGLTVNTGEGPVGVVVSDLDYDGRPDLVVARRDANEVVVLAGLGDGTFAEQARLSVTYPTCLAAGDVDRDGWIDLIATSGWPHEVVVMSGNGDGTFNAARQFGTGGHSAFVTLADFDRDDRPDLVTANRSTDDVSVLINQDEHPASIFIDVKPGEDPNSINPGAAGMIAVAILGGETFDVSDIAADTIVFGDGAASIAHPNPHRQDVNDDGYMDLLAHFRIGETGIDCGDVRATLTAETFEGRSLTGSDSIRTVGCQVPRRPADWIAEPGPPGNEVLTLEESWKLLAADGEAGDWFGGALALSGDRCIVGAQYEDAKGYSAGAAYVFVNIGTTWHEEDKMVAWDGADYDWYGSSIALLGDSAAVGSPNRDGREGAAYLFDRSGSKWGGLRSLAGSQGYGRFGCSVALSDERLVVGEGYRKAGVSVFLSSGSTLEAFLPVPAYAWDDQLGVSVAISGDTIVAGTPTYPINGPDSGAAVIFARGADGTWSKQATLVPSDGSPHAYFGRQVAIDDGTVVVGALGPNSDGTYSGAVYVFERDTTGNWVEQSKLGSSDHVTENALGLSVDIEKDRLVAGAAGTPGSAYVFEEVDGGWSLMARLLATDLEEDDGFGTAVSISGDLVAVGAPHHGNTAEGATGAGYVFTLPVNVEIDVKPDSEDNRVNPASHGVVAVAVFGNEAFDVHDLDVATLRLGRGGATIAHWNGHLKDVNFDGHADLLARYWMQASGIACGDERVTLTGQTTDGRSVRGVDSIRTTGCNERGLSGSGTEDQDRAEPPGGAAVIDIGGKVPAH
jgi:hypothetical protein